jgi:hypothetical protein
VSSASHAHRTSQALHQTIAISTANHQLELLEHSKKQSKSVLKYEKIKNTLESTKLSLLVELEERSKQAKQYERLRVNVDSAVVDASAMLCNSLVQSPASGVSEGRRRFCLDFLCFFLRAIIQIPHPAPQLQQTHHVRDTYFRSKMILFAISCYVSKIVLQSLHNRCRTLYNCFSLALTLLYTRFSLFFAVALFRFAIISQHPLSTLTPPIFILRHIPSSLLLNTSHYLNIHTHTTQHQAP